MGAIGDIFRQFGPEYLRRFGDAMPNEHRKVIEAITLCRTEDNGAVVYRCEQCGRDHILNRSCGNRHCPQCQSHKTKLWLERQMERMLPGHHFMLTFTVPEELRDFIRSHQRICYAALFAASSAALKKLCLDPRHVGGDLPGFFGVLHTWGRQLYYHPHIHYVVPGGAISTTDGRWRRSGEHFYLPVKALSAIFRAKFRDRLEKAGLAASVPEEAWRKPWIVNSQAVGKSEASIKYLAPYVFRVAISDNRIVKVENGRVFFRYKKHGSNRLRTMDLEVMEFMRRFLQHVLPTGFMKVRYYGFMSPNSAIPLVEVKAKIELAYGFDVPEGSAETKQKPALTCRDCGSLVRFLFVNLPVNRWTRGPSG
ncbi:MAG: hypothetical protein FD174_3760 [Geobacteraceae bacterium]|nr:MAG: hypothetical protein FD174_3760 [Geobacteraceae bacterium]